MDARTTHGHVWPRTRWIKGERRSASHAPSSSLNPSTGWSRSSPQRTCQLSAPLKYSTPRMLDRSDPCSNSSWSLASPTLSRSPWRPGPWLCRSSYLSWHTYDRSNGLRMRHRLFFSMESWGTTYVDPATTCEIVSCSKKEIVSCVALLYVRQRCNLYYAVARLYLNRSSRVEEWKMSFWIILEYIRQRWGRSL
jgi:hypothetical protein